ncbi:Tyrosinase family protein asqI [Colletotrichum gloeosporioides]|uniref:Tyrosinase family protein asqI n=1 Tax=Colletotrichum gloeosporioides TaxID=474922 RepID=A0A8H4CDE5_COLGL|nr:Tyrosinase family protein asqI [Colletotrichum gloeosporioides]KAF3801973.1 Tyrosinase family protein asqI [Colletotrichum gloeosporioides]
MKNLLLNVVIAAICAEVAASRQTFFPNELQSGDVHVDFASTSFDGPRLSPGPNATTYDWWYFDAVSTSSNESISIVFLMASSTAFPSTDTGGPMSVIVSGSFANGSAFSHTILASGGALIIESEDKDEINGAWGGGNASFGGRGLDSNETSFKIILNSPKYGVYGSLSLRSTLPSRYPCGLNAPGAEQQVFPGVGWLNPQPDASAIAHFKLGDAALDFSGSGYHDKNWGSVPFTQAVGSWHWGHARIGPYSMVWIDARSPTGDTHRSGLVTKNGTVLLSSCASDSVGVTTWGDGLANSTSGLLLEFGLIEGGHLTMNITRTVVIVNSPVYLRYLGAVSGRVGDEFQFVGVASLDAFNFTVSS